MLVHLLALLGVLYVQGECPVDKQRRTITSASGMGMISINATQYLTGLDCQWTITNLQLCPSGTPIVMLKWVSVKTEPVDDIITIYDGDSDDARMLQQVSGNKTDVPVNSSSVSVLISFVTDPDAQGDEEGFSLSYDFGCGPKLNTSDMCSPAKNPRVISITSTGTLQFTDWRGAYQDCYWLISNDMAGCNDPYLEVEFTNFSALFPYDYLELFDGDTKNQSAQIGHYQGSRVYDGPGSQKSIGKKLLISFHNEYAHPSDAWTGFIATFRARCDAKPSPNCPLRADPKVFNSTGYMVFNTAHYIKNDNCYFVFRNTNKSCVDPVVLMIFPAFRTVELYDTVTLWDGNNAGVKAAEIGKWSGTAGDAVPVGFQRSTQSEVWMEFHSGSAYSLDFNRGFTVQFAFPCGEDLPKPAPITCPGYLNGVKSPIQPPGILNFTANSYRNNLDCGWMYLNNRTDCPSGSSPVVQLEFLHFETELNFDYANIYDGPLSRKGTLPYNDRFLLGSYSGSRGWEIPTVVRSTEPSLLLTFHSDGTVNDVDLDSHNDGIVAKVSHVCSIEPLPQKPNYDCRGDSGSSYARFWTAETLQNPRVTFGHHYLPFSLAYPTVIEQYFTYPEPISMLSTRGAAGTQGEIVVGYGMVHPGTDRDLSNWRCCGDLNTTKPVTGTILLCERGDCFFIEKIRTAQRYGAVGAIVVDTSEYGVRMGSTTNATGVVIPSVSTVASLGAMIRETIDRAPMFAQLASFTCAQGTLSPATTANPTPSFDQPTSLRAPTPPSPPTPLPPNATMFFTLPVASSGFSQDVRDQFMDSINTFFLWVPGTGTLSSFGPDPEDKTATVAQVLVNSRDANIAFAKWGSATSLDKLMLSPKIVSITLHQPHERCIAEDCESTSLRNAEWDPHECSCSRSMTGGGAFVYVILPIFLCLLFICLLCCCCPFCPFYNRWKRDQAHQKVAMDDMHLQDVHMMPPGVKDSEESRSMRGEGQPFGDTLDDDDHHVAGSALVHPVQTDQEVLRIAHPRSDDSDDEAEKRVP